MLPILAAACIVLVVAGLAASGPTTRPQPPAHLRKGALARVPAPASDQPVDGPRPRPWGRVALTTVTAVVLVAAIGVLGYPFYTNLLQNRIQSKLDRQLSSEDLKQAYVERRVEVGDSLTRIQIPDIKVDVVVVEGTTASALRAGAGHYPDTPLPCEAGNVAIAGHRTTYGRPFHNVDLLDVGDEITLVTPIGTCAYEVTQKPFPVSPTTTTVLANTPGEATLTLTTCHPKGSARQRLIVKAKLVSRDVQATADQDAT